MAYRMDGLAGGLAWTAEGAGAGVLNGGGFVREAGYVLLQERGSRGVRWRDYLVCVNGCGWDVGKLLGDVALTSQYKHHVPPIDFLAQSWTSLLRQPHETRWSNMRFKWDSEVGSHGMRVNLDMSGGEPMVAILVYPGNAQCDTRACGETFFLRSGLSRIRVLFCLGTDSLKYCRL
jgi:hypothetical protein